MPRSLVTPLAAFCVALAWSGGWIAGKLGVTSAPPLEFSAVRFIIAGLALGAIARATRRRIGSGGLAPIVLSAVFGYLGYNAFVFVGLTMAPASDAALIVPTTIPVLTAIAASFFGEHLGPTKIAGFVLASIGAALVIAAGQSGGGVSGARGPGGPLMVRRGAGGDRRDVLVLRPDPHARHGGRLPGRPAAAVAAPRRGRDPRRCSCRDAPDGRRTAASGGRGLTRKGTSGSLARQAIRSPS